MFGVGSAAADLLFVGEGPGRDEDLAGEPFVGRSGKLLDRLMWEEVGLTRAECYIANVVKCRPPQNRDPAPKEIEACRPYLAEQIRLIDPRVIITLGNFATKLLLETTKGIRELRGQVFERGRANVVPTYHPAYVLRAGGEAMAEMRADFVRAKRLMTAGRRVSWPVTWTSESPDDTRELAGRVAGLCRPGDVVLAGGRPRDGQDGLRPGLRRRPGGAGPGDQPDLRSGAPVPLRGGEPGRAAHPRRRVPDRLAGGGGRPGAGRVGRRGRGGPGRVGRAGGAGAGRQRARDHARRP